MMDQTKFKDLSMPLKIAIIMAWIAGTIFTISFIIGFIQGMLSI